MDVYSVRCLGFLQITYYSQKLVMAVSFYLPSHDPEVTKFYGESFFKQNGEWVSIGKHFCDGKISHLFEKKQQ